jgi:hypothetical protein
MMTMVPLSSRGVLASSGWPIVIGVVSQLGCAAKGLIDRACTRTVAGGPQTLGPRWTFVWSWR